MNFVKNLQEISSIYTEYVGGKAANLGELILKGIPVPNGFVITNKVYHVFAEANNIKKVELSCDKTLLQKAFIEGIIPSKVKNDIILAYAALSSTAESNSVAIRSSAIAEDSKIASFAGQMDTYLNISGEENLILTIKKIYASLWGDKVTKYREKKEIFEENGIAIIVQQMINCDVSGVLFTENPLTGNRAEIMINAAYGLGETVVSGITTPDEYICDKKGNVISALLGSKESQIAYIDGKILEKPVPIFAQRRFAINSLLLKKLVDISIQIERLFKVPMDIEWGLKDGEIFILQARPITVTF